MPHSPAALVIAHPGHELRLYHWLERDRPVVFVITDGSGSGRQRVDSTRETLAMSGATPGSIFGAFSDHEIYRMILEGTAGPVIAMTLELAQSFLTHGIRSVVADAFEAYNPTHDLCAVVASLAAEKAGLDSGRPLACYDYAVTAGASHDGETIVLDDAAVARKIDAAARVTALKPEIDALVGRFGEDVMRREVLRPLPVVLELPELTPKPFYETHGEARVAEGRYRTVIRYEDHFRPFVEHLTRGVRSAIAPSSHRVPVG